MARADLRTRLLTGMLALCCAGAVSAQELEFVEPVGSTVRGTVPVRVDLGRRYRDGFVSFYIGRTGEDLKFHVATLSDAEGLFGFTWETQTQASDVPDGEYRVLAIGHNSVGEPIGQKAVSVNVQNSVSADQAILLRYELTPGSRIRYQARTTASSTPLEDTSKKDIAEFDGNLNALWTNRVLFTNPDGRARVRNDIYRMSATLVPGMIVPMAGAGDTVSVLQEATGRTIRLQHGGTPLFPFTDIGFEFPKQGIKLGESWRSAMTVVVDPRSVKLDRVMATHTLEDVVWFGGHRCAKIRSEFESGPYLFFVEEKEPPPAAAGGDMGMGGGMGDMGMSMGSEGGELGTQVSAEERSATALVRGVRTTFFAYQSGVGRILKVEEQQEQRFVLALAKQPEVSAAGGIGGMDGGGFAEPGMAPPGIPGGAFGGPAMPPGAMGGMSGMDPGMSGMGGMDGTMTMAPAEPPKIEVKQFRRQVSTVVERY